MKVLLDENVDVEFRHHLPGHDVYTVTFLGWRGTRNGALIARAAVNGFEVLVTIDRGVAFQQNIGTLPLILATLHPRSDRLPDLIPLAPALLAELARTPLPKRIDVYP
jgi:hypothetical protein